MWSYSCLFPFGLIFLLGLVLRTVFKFVFWVIFAVASIAASHWAIWCLSGSCVPAGGASDEVPVIHLDFDPIAPG
jgi:hypothetical protein